MFLIECMSEANVILREKYPLLIGPNTQANFSLPKQIIADIQDMANNLNVAYSHIVVIAIQELKEKFSWQPNV